MSLQFLGKNKVLALTLTACGAGPEPPVEEEPFLPAEETLPDAGAAEPGQEEVNLPEEPEDLRDFDRLGYRFSPADSTPAAYVFLKAQERQRAAL